MPAAGGPPAGPATAREESAVTVLLPTDSSRSGRQELRQGAPGLRNRVDSCPRNEVHTPKIVEEERRDRVNEPVRSLKSGSPAPLRGDAEYGPDPIENP